LSPEGNARCRGEDFKPLKGNQNGFIAVFSRWSVVQNDFVAVFKRWPALQNGWAANQVAARRGSHEF